MKTLERIVLCIVCSLFFFPYNIEGETLGMHKGKIDWSKDDGENTRSLSPIDGYVEDGTVVLYLHEKPEVAKVTIRDNAGSVVHESIVNGSEVVEIEVEGIGEYKIKVEYASSLYEGTFTIM